MAATALLRQNAFRWRNDDGGETDATWFLALNEQLINPVQPVSFGRIRIEILEYAGKNARDSSFVMISRVNGGAWYAFGNANCPLKRFDSPFITGAPPTTQQISTGTFVPGNLIDAGSTAVDPITITSNARTEFETSIELDIDKFGTVYNEGDTIDLAMAYADLTVLDDYTVLPTFTVAALTAFSNVYLGGTKITEFYLGANKVPHLYLGGTEVYRNTT